MRNNNGRSPKPCGSCFPRLCKGCAARLAYPILFGLGDGSPDVVGIITFTKTPLLPRVVLAVAFGVEAKKEGRYLERDQKAWRAQAERKGMRVGLARCSDEAVAFVDEVIESTLAALGDEWYVS